MVSKSFQLINKDWEKWAYNASIFFVPVALVFVGELVKIVPQDWQYGALVLYILNVVTDLIKKWASTNSYKK
jgi:hypothetical protein